MWHNSLVGDIKGLLACVLPATIYYCYAMFSKSLIRALLDGWNFPFKFDEYYLMCCCYARLLG